jgi:endonuclease/exonuclease/phosphatase (EEP) superfamily protein YafD
MTIVATHLEDKTKPEGRRKQLEELLNRISAVNATVVVAGDMNHIHTTARRFRSSARWRIVLEARVSGPNRLWEFWRGVRLPTLLLTGMNTYRTQADPTVRSIPLVATNPKAEFFDKLKDFRLLMGTRLTFEASVSVR